MGDWVWEGTHDNRNIVQWFGDARDMPKLEAYFPSALGSERATGRFKGKKSDIFGAFCVLHLLASGVPVDKIWHLRHVSCSAGIVDGLNTIMKKAWWRRIWVVQETVVAKSPVLYYGNMCAPWRLFALAAVEYDACRFTRVIMEIESTRRGWRELAPMVPLTVLRKFRSRLATDPRDKVFAVLGLIRSWGTEMSGQAMKGISPDYTIQDSQLFLKATELLIRNTRSLATLAGTLQQGLRSTGNLF
ncbi:hypothetical protein ONZ43_g4070 [Nemania bipapillata]|uniref:Uncharacterized protein n=1 Tax=Nemania bipapillata TaxID=110536 RepID=A0ACC2ISA1_9PEZI|nr:hypothetical protein ONZ43_g4070 [Nemania bipapillata]